MVGWISHFEVVMKNSNLIVDLEPRPDKKENIYYIGRLQAPITIDLSNGATFLVFLSESGDEELQIAVNNKENTTFSSCKRKRDRLEVRLDARDDQHGAKFYVAKLLMNGYINCHEEVVFMVFISREGSEQLQIVAEGNIITSQEKSRSRGVEVIRKRRPNTWSDD